jgi:hypothetical protein
MQKAETAHVRMTLRRAALFALGWILVLGGVLGLFLPVVPGAVLILAGVAVLSPQSAWLRRTLAEYRVRFPVLKHLGCGGTATGAMRTIPLRHSEFENDAGCDAKRSIRGQG